MSDTIHQDNIDQYRKFSLRDGAKIYTELREEVLKNGLLNRSYGHYAIQITAIYTGFITSLVAIYFTQNPLLFLLLSFAFAFFSVQIAGLVHDSGHRAIFASPKFNDLAGHFFASTVGSAYGNWKISHDRHHANPNQDGFDPDVEVPFSFTQERFKNSKGLAKLVARYQAYAYYPLGTLTSLSVRFKKMTYFRENWGPKVYGQVILFTIFAFIHFSFPLVLFGITKGLLFLIIVTLIEGFYLFNIFAPNHKGMPEVGKDVQFSFFEHQIITARNIKGSSLIDYLYLGLNYQIEHHLFPNMPRNNLRKIVPFVKQFCKKHGIEYTETNAFESNVIIFNEMREISKQYA